MKTTRTAARTETRTANTYWETSGDGKVKRLVREFFVDGHSVGFEVVTTRNLGWY